jgi:hypothetical protein
MKPARASSGRSPKQGVEKMEPFQQLAGEKFDLRIPTHYTSPYTLRARRRSMVPPSDDPRWRALLDGSVTHEFKSVPAGLMVSRLKRQVGNDGSEANWEKSIQEMRAFFEKYEHITTYDLTAIFS